MTEREQPSTQFVVEDIIYLERPSGVTLLVRWQRGRESAFEVIPWKDEYFDAENSFEMIAQEGAARVDFKFRLFKSQSRPFSQLRPMQSAKITKAFERHVESKGLKPETFLLANVPEVARRFTALLEQTYLMDLYMKELTTGPSPDTVA
jgi:hypothetical protein